MNPTIHLWADPSTKLDYLFEVKLSAAFGFLFVLMAHLLWAQGLVFSSSDLPIIVINTGNQAILDEPKVVVDMGIIYNGPGVKNNLSDPFNHFNGKVGIERRGSSSQMFPKVQYGIELRTASGADMDQSLLGLPAEEDWILFAPYNDKTLMRDVLAYKFARDMNHYASRSRYCELVIDNDYRGVYVLLEKIKRDPMRLDIADLNIDENSGDELTGGYILKLDKTSGGSGSAGFSSIYTPPSRSGSQTIYFQYEYPKGAEITAAQKKYIGDFINGFETTMRGPKWLDPVDGYLKFINLPSFIDFFIMNEVTKNPDGYRLSTFMYKEKDSKGGRLHMGPVWDFNLGFGNVNYCTNWEPSGYAKDFNRICPSDSWLIPFWWDYMWNDPAFRGPLFARWVALRNGPLKTQTVFDRIDSAANVLTNSGAQQRNFAKWPVLGKYVWPNPPAYSSLVTYEQEVNWLKTWIAQRLAWLDNNLAYVINGVNDQPTEQLITMTPSPNPFKDELSFNYTLSHGASVSIDLYDVLGRSVYNMTEMDASPGDHTSSAGTSSLADGLYFYRMILDGQVVASGHLNRLH